VQRPPTAHYLDVALSPTPGATSLYRDQFAFAADVVAIVHRGIVGGLWIAVAFPNLGVDHRSPAARVRLFGAPDGLAALRRPLCDLSARAPARAQVAVGLVAETPQAGRLAAFSRDRSGDREHLGHRERALLRAQGKAVARSARGEGVAKPALPMEDRVAAAFALRDANSTVARIMLPMRSASSGRRFAVWVRRHEAPNSPPDEGAVGTYGLSGSPMRDVGADGVGTAPGLLGLPVF